MVKTQKLTKLDWIKAGFRALAIGGFRAIAIEPIARELKSTKGSFYWHFKDLAALKSAMLEYYKSIGTEAIIMIANQQLGPLESLAFTFRAALNPPDNDLGGRDAELAVRDWARYDDEAREMLVNIDKARINFLFEKSCQLGLSKADASFRASTLYAIYLGAINMRSNDLDFPTSDLINYMVGTIKTPN